MYAYVRMLLGKGASEDQFRTNLIIIEDADVLDLCFMKLVHPVIFLLAGEGHRLCVADTSPAHF
jgi:hypothetical protein